MVVVSLLRHERRDRGRRRVAGLDVLLNWAFSGVGQGCTISFVELFVRQWARDLGSRWWPGGPLISTGDLS